MNSRVRVLGAASCRGNVAEAKSISIPIWRKTAVPVRLTEKPRPVGDVHRHVLGQSPIEETIRVGQTLTISLCDLDLASQVQQRRQLARRVDEGWGQERSTSWPAVANDAPSGACADDGNSHVALPWCQTFVLALHGNGSLVILQGGAGVEAEAEPNGMLR